MFADRTSIAWHGAPGTIDDGNERKKSLPADKPLTGIYVWR
ncbi:MAG: hypothetical protein KatS3mg111_0703 [Pirellulaceae bacterium]|nr:MAG: hypothetical protein KatS3mg111_0703 [Pirellulaceae bacterium]